MGHNQVDITKCTRCGICRTVCPARIILPDADAYPTLPDSAAEDCIDCGHCEVFCAAGALTHVYSNGSDRPAVYKSPGITAAQMALYVKSRRSVRNFTSTPADKDTLLKLMDAVRYAPTAVNLQPVKWVLVQDAEKTRALAGLAVDWMRHLVETGAPMADMLGAAEAIEAWENGTDTIFRHAPQLAAVYAPVGNPMADTDGLIALSTLDLLLPAFGLGGFWAGYFKFAADAWPPITQALGLPEGCRVVHAVAFGRQKYPVAAIPARKPPDIIWK